MKLAREPASSRPKPCASLKKPHESCPFAAPCGPRRKKNDRGQRSAFPSETSRFALSILAHRGSALPWLVNDRATLRIRRIWCVPTLRELSGSPRQCSLPLACRHPPEGHQIGARKRRTPENTILSQPHCRRVSTDRPNREESSQLAASLEGEPGPTPAGKTLPHTLPRNQVSEGEGTIGPTTTIFFYRQPVLLALLYMDQPPLSVILQYTVYMSHVVYACFVSNRRY